MDKGALPVKRNFFKNAPSPFIFSIEGKRLLRAKSLPWTKKVDLLSLSWSDPIMIFFPGRGDKRKWEGRVLLPLRRAISLEERDRVVGGGNYKISKTYKLLSVGEYQVHTVELRLNKHQYSKNFIANFLALAFDIVEKPQFSSKIFSASFHFSFSEFGAWTGGRRRGRERSKKYWGPRATLQKLLKRGTGAIFGGAGMLMAASDKALRKALSFWEKDAY